MDDRKKKILICPLGWGLGHASRDIPIIDALLKNGHEVIVAGDEQTLTLLSNHFEEIRTIPFPSFKVFFSKSSNQLRPLLWVAIRLPYYIIKEHFALNRLVKRYNVDLVISDNRYGLWCKNAKTVFITHQVKVFFPSPFRFLEPIGAKAIWYFIEKFDKCWIPDFIGEDNLAGDLSHPPRLPLNAQYIGILSRFSGVADVHTKDKWGLVGIVSGPSPQKELFIEQIEKLARKHEFRTLIVKGAPSEGTSIIEKEGIFYAGHLDDADFRAAIQSSKYLITRSGYSTIMDLIAMGVRGMIVPTPGQTEQEYLAEYLSNKGIFTAEKQGKLENVDIFKLQVSHKLPYDSNELLRKAIEMLIL